MDVVQGGAPAPAINIVCPHYLNGADPQEQHIIYNVQVVELDPKRCVIECVVSCLTQRIVWRKKYFSSRSSCRAASRDRGLASLPSAPSRRRRSEWLKIPSLERQETLTFIESPNENHTEKPDRDRVIDQVHSSIPVYHLEFDLDFEVHQSEPNLCRSKLPWFWWSWSQTTLTETQIWTVPSSQSNFWGRSTLWRGCPIFLSRICLSSGTSPSRFGHSPPCLVE